MFWYLFSSLISLFILFLCFTHEHLQQDFICTNMYDLHSLLRYVFFWWSVHYILCWDIPIWYHCIALSLHCHWWTVSCHPFIILYQCLDICKSMSSMKYAWSHLKDIVQSPCFSIVRTLLYGCMIWYCILEYPPFVKTPLSQLPGPS